MAVNTGVKPIGVIEPLTGWQKEGLQQLAGYQPTGPGAAGYMQGGQQAFQQALGQAGNLPINQSFQRGTDFYNTASSNLAAGTAGISGADIAGYFNPYTDQVTNRAISRINEQGDATRSRLMAAQAGRRSFGDSSSAIQQSELDKNVLGQVGDTSAQLGYQGWQNALGQVNNDRNRSLQGAQIAGGLGAQNVQAGYQGFGALQDLARTAWQGNAANWSNFQNQKANTLQNIQNKINAGGAVQNQNQKLLDVVNNEYGRMQGFDQNQLAALAPLLQIFNSSTSTGQSGGESNLLGKLGGVAMTAAGMYSGGGAGGGNAMPSWGGLY